MVLPLFGINKNVATFEQASDFIFLVLDVTNRKYFKFPSLRFKKALKNGNKKFTWTENNS
jgi:hypothetical protein